MFKEKNNYHGMNLRNEEKCKHCKITDISNSNNDKTPKFRARNPKKNIPNQLIKP